MFTYREERRLFAAIGLVIIAALVALVQITSARSGSVSPLTAGGTAVAYLFEEVAGTAVLSSRDAALGALRLPGLERENRALRLRNVDLERENQRLYELAVSTAGQAAIAPRLATYRGAVSARVVGFPPENTDQGVTIDRGTSSGVHRDDGVLAASGVVGRVVEAGPFSSKVALVTDFSSTIPAVVQRGRSWGIARGNLESVRLEYVSQDAPLHLGDKVVTGEGRSFHSGDVIGSIVRIERGDSNLYQTAILKPSVDLGTLDRVVVVPK
ncbi:MAG: rod shape-determining protein MreC [Candidatus Eremiobacteraeota bacterium]|nr:rod shape-determining protein MreC [Candidatus Eremiobacteraeota bacterium]